MIFISKNFNIRFCLFKGNIEFGWEICDSEEESIVNVEDMKI